MKFSLPAFLTVLAIATSACGPQTPGTDASTSNSVSAAPLPVDSARGPEVAKEPANNPSPNPDAGASANPDANARKAGPKSTLIWGIDVDDTHGQIDWAAAKGGGVHFTYIRASNGSSGVDGKFKANWNASKREGVRRGAYHHFVVGNDNVTQLTNFQKQFTMGDGDLAPAIRFDGKSIPNNVRLNQAAVQKALAGFFIEAEKALGCKPVIFTEPGFADNYLADPALTKNPLWINSPNGEAPRMPKLWNGKSWTLWTFSDAGTVPGIGGNVHRTKYHSSATEFAAQMPCAKP